MLTNEQHSQVLPKLTTILIIHVALVLGVVMFALIVGFLTDWSQLTNEAGMLPLMAAITGLMTYGMSFIMPKMLRGSTANIAATLVKQKQSIDIPDQTILDVLVGNQMTSRIIAGALMEGGLFLNLVVFMIEPNTVSIAVFVIGILLFVFRTPLLGRQLDRLENELSDVRRELQLFR
jgi:F0F1-type ATP synthase membrane subunit c/vacuolar-type H+-ATPase subunit K